eukprot:5205582-Alexandrium_andersonii.AAC.1
MAFSDMIGFGRLPHTVNTPPGRASFGTSGRSRMPGYGRGPVGARQLRFAFCGRLAAVHQSSPSF